MAIDNPAWPLGTLGPFDDVDTPEGKRRGAQVDDEYLFKVVDALDAVAKETGNTVSQIALNWCGFAERNPPPV
jgi:aryl-alcohol dehydrogenase-like predicted oxidoreductase